MITWSKFEDPFAIESAGFSDMVYPLTQATLNQVDAVDHAAALLQSDMLQNADDRRFALAQSSAARHSYNFRSNKVRQMECAVDTLSNYIRRREALYYEQSSTDEGDDEEEEVILAETNRVDLRQDLSGIATTSIPEDQLSECQLSPSSPRHTSLPPRSPRQTPRPASRPRAAVTRSTPASSFTSYIDARCPASTAPTSNSHGLSIADLIHPSPATFTVAKGLSPQLTPDPDLDNASQELHSPDPDFLQATLASIRTDREFHKYCPVLTPTYHRAASLARAAGLGRNLRFPRMRRSSKSRDHGGKVSCHEVATYEADLRAEASPRPSSPSHGEHINHQQPPRTQIKVAEPCQTRETVAATRAERTALDAWWDTQRELHHCAEDDELDTMPAPTPKPLMYANARTASEFKAMPPMNGRPASPLSPARVIRAHEVIEVDDTEDLYAYSLPGANPKPSSSTATTYRYGYIAGDVPGARDGKLRMRAPARERTLGKGGKPHGQQRTVSGVKRRRESDDQGKSPELGRCPEQPQPQQDRSKCKRQLITRGSSESDDGVGLELEGSGGKGTTALTAGQTSDSRMISDDEEVDQELIREARRIAERWWKEPLVPSKT